MRKILLPTLVVGLLTVLLGGPAHADALGFRDATGDLMVAKVTDQSAETGGFEYAGSSSPNGDIISSRYEHTRKSVVLYVRYREIYLPKQMSGWYFHLVGSNKFARDLEVYATPNAIGGRAQMVNRRGNKVRCKVASKINYTTNSIKVKFPRRCMSWPRSVRISHVSYWTKISNDSFFVYYDDPSRAGGTVDQAGARSTRWIKAS
jgi:hypothetical protein